ncbi:MAG: hypothetical protein GX020_05460 [Firmicutes bacterium]|nr:hypothetical protein [Bacillota bacterium]
MKRHFMRVFPLIVLLTLLIFTGVVMAETTETNEAENRFEVPFYTGFIFESNYEPREWTLRRSVPGYGRRFEASFVGVAGFDSSSSQLMLTFILEDGRKRALPLSSFSDEDQEYALAIHRELQKERAALREANDVGEYTAPREGKVPENFELGAPFMGDPWTYTPKAGEIFVDYSKYFRFVSGKHTRLSGNRWFDESFREMNRDYFDVVFDFGIHELGFPAPYSDETTNRKIDVTVTGTGIGEGWAFGSTQIWINPEAMHEGSTVVPHEFAHVLQEYSGGFKGNNTGWYWETHANWFAHQFRPDSAPALEVYNDRINHHLSSTRMNYGSWPFIQYIAENPKLGPSYPNRIWYESERHNSHLPRRRHGAAMEDAFQALMRIGYEEGVFNHPETGFGDIIGEMAARNVTWDYTFNHTYKDVAQPNRFNRTVLHEAPDKPGWYMVPYALAPQQYGYNVIELIPEPGATKIEVNFQGLLVEEGADWRATIVVVDKDGWPRYSRMWNNGICSMEIQEGDKEFYLTVAATPSIYRQVVVNQGFRSIVKYPYEVKFSGATPATYHPDHLTVGHLFGLMGDPHPNGGGFVSRSAKVDETVYVGPNAVVFGAARITGNARIEDYAVVMDFARVGGNAIIAGNAVVRDSVRVEGNAVVRDALVRGQVTVNESARILDGMLVEGSGFITGNATLKGRGSVNTTVDNVRGTIGGATIVGINSEWKAWTSNPVTDGIFYDLAERAGSARGRTNYVYANYTFDEPNYALVKDTLYYNDGILRGAPEYKVDGNRKVLELNGVNQYVLLGKDIAEFDQVTYEMTVKWFGGESNQRIFDFSRDETNGMYLTPSNADGKLEFVVLSEGVAQSIVSSTALPVDQWVKIELTIKNGEATLKIDNALIGTIKNLENTPVSLRTKANYLGRSFDGRTYFNGQFDDFKVTRIPAN